MKKILLLLVLALGLLGFENINSDISIMKSKPHIEHGIGWFNFSIASENIGLNRRRFDGYSESNQYDSNYLAHVSITIDNVSVFDAALSPYLAANPFFWLKFKDFTDSDDITYVITDNHGKSIRQSFKIDRRDVLKNQKATIQQKSVKPIALSAKAWDAVTVDSAIKAVYPLYDFQGTEETETQFSRDDIVSRKIRDDSKECMTAPGYDPFVSIASNIDLRRIAIFSTTTPKPLLAFIQLPDNVLIKVAIPFKLERSGKVFLIAEGKDNKLYRSEVRDIVMALYGEDPPCRSVNFNLENKSKK